MPPKGSPKKGGKGKKGAAPTQEQLDFDGLTLRAAHAEAAALQAQRRMDAQTVDAAAREAALGAQAVEVDEMYTYLDTQMLHSTHERRRQQLPRRRGQHAVGKDGLQYWNEDC